MSEVQNKWIIPDRLNHDVPFIFTGMKMFIDTRESNHYEMLDDHRITGHLAQLDKQIGKLWKFAQTDDIDNMYDHYNRIREIATGVALFGRAGEYKGQSAVAFWNSSEATFKKLLEGCVEELRSREIIDDDPLVSVSYGSTTQVFRWGDRDKAELFEMSPEEQEKLEALQQMHQAQGVRKKQLMRKAGVGFKGRAPAEQQRLDAGLMRPESFDRRLGRALFN